MACHQLPHAGPSQTSFDQPRRPRPRRAGDVPRTAAAWLSRSGLGTAPRRCRSGRSGPPTCALVPRSGSIVGTRCSDSRPGEVEDHRVPGRGGDGVGVLRQAAAAEVGAGVLRRRRASRARSRRRSSSRSIRPQLRPAGGRGPCRAGRRSTGSRSAGAWRVPVEAVAVAVALQQLELGHPVELAGAQHRVAAASRVEHRLPALQHVEGLRVGVGAEPVLDVLARPARGTPSAAATAVSLRPSRSVTRSLQRRVVRDRVQRRAPARRRARSVVMKPVLDHRQHQRGGADLEVGRDLGTGWRRR